MEDSAMDMESMGPLRPQTFLFGCELKADKEYQFKVDDEENEHQLSLRTASISLCQRFRELEFQACPMSVIHLPPCSYDFGSSRSARLAPRVTLGAGAKDELHVVEAEALDYEGNPVKVVLASLKMSVQPTAAASVACLDFFESVLLMLYEWNSTVLGVDEMDNVQVALEEEPESDDEEDDTKIVNTSTKRPASGGGAKTPQKKPKLSEDDEEDDEDDDDEDDDDEDDLEDDEEEIKTPMKKPVREASGKNMQKAKQNGKDSKPSTPSSKSKTPDSKKDKTLTPKTPKVPLSLEEIKAKMQASIDKGSSLPKLEPKFANYVKNCFRTEDQKQKDENVMFSMGTKCHLCENLSLEPWQDEPNA
ncbi:Npm1 [Columba guinea]|nr:Npm1 [Columba guinea]